MKLKKRALLFGAVGTVGFLMDAGIYQAIQSFFSPYLSRAFSFLSAVLTTWALNRSITFRDYESRQSSLREAGFYLALMLAGGCLNYIIFAILITWKPFVGHYPVVGIAAGSLAGMGFNFISSKTFLFRHSKSR